MKHTPIQNYRVACDRAERRLKEARASAERRLAAEQKKCPHTERGYDVDPSGNSGGGAECLRCGKHFRKGEK